MTGKSGRDRKFRHKCPRHGLERCHIHCRRVRRAGTHKHSKSIGTHRCRFDLDFEFKGRSYDTWQLCSAPRF